MEQEGCLAQLALTRLHKRAQVEDLQDDMADLLEQAEEVQV